MSSAYLGSAAKLRTACTGEPITAAAQRVTRLDRGVDPLPAAADPDQEMFEWWVNHRCAWPDDFTTSPFGFTSVVPAVNGLTLVAEDRPAHVRGLVMALLPTLFEGQVDGVPGLRVTRSRRDGALTLRLAGTDANVTLRGISAATWKSAVEEWREDLKYGVEQLWESSPGEVTREERQLMAWFPTTADGGRPHWLGSALLRRAHAFTAAGWPINVTGWITGGDRVDRWKYDIEFIPGQRFDHQQLVSLLTDPLVGLPLVADVACGCGSGEDSMCRVNLTGDGNLPNAVQLILRYSEPETVEGWEARWPHQVSAVRAAW
ncbi:hypothetical protein AB0D10_00740 [Kitasatospora sp. NPDC048545]|uniref:hypothetical protein n=1 Tax=Kitasatospora sp. NPDC048545 TaxID=3157208 RepID=UPI0033DE8ED5